MKTLLDTDLYKLTMMQAVWLKQPQATARYQFINRRQQDRFNPAFLECMLDEVRELCDTKFTTTELDYLRGLGYFRDDFLENLREFQFCEDDLDINLSDGELSIVIEGKWVDTILWEVPLMAIISEVYFETVDRNWNDDVDAYYERTLAKARRLTEGGCAFVDFGTRRRRSYAMHDAVIRAFNAPGVRCAGTSNVHFAKEFGMRPMGTMAHEWIMGYAGIYGVERANEIALQDWREVFGDALDTALTDTYTTELFLQCFRGELAQAYGAVRQDSGDPFAFIETMLRFYEEQGIDPATKRMIFSDGLDVDQALEIERFVAGRTHAAYGIGTHFTNDFPGSRALNMVIKLFGVNGRPVAKISDGPGKESGDDEAVNKARQAIEAMGITTE